MFCQVIEEKDKEQKLLETRLNETKEESEVAKLEALKAKNDVIMDFADLMEDELQCSICSELFIKVEMVEVDRCFFLSIFFIFQYSKYF